MTADPRPEIVVGLVTPIGTKTAELASAISGVMSDYGYQAVTVKLSDHLPCEAGALGEGEDSRVRRLIKAGDDFCRSNTKEKAEGDPAAIARLAVREIRKARLLLKRQDGATGKVEEEVASGRPSTAYVLHSLKRPAEIQLLRQIYAGQFVLIGSQGTLAEREANLLLRPMPSSDDDEKREIARQLIQLDADERDPVGQRVNEAYPQADFFLRDNDVERTLGLLFGEPIAPAIGEFAMYVARASRARSLAASRKVGAAIVVEDAVVATGYNDVPSGETPDVVTGIDTSEIFKRANVEDTLSRLDQAGLLKSDGGGPGDLVDEALAALKGGDLMSVIEYQRAVHAESRAIDDAAVRGISPAGGTLYVTTYPCHLCYKHALSARLDRVEYIEPYPKSRAAAMYPETGERLVPYAGVAPRRYIELFDDRPAFLSDPSGKFEPIDRRVATPLLGHVRNDADRDAEERLSVNGLLEEYQ